MVLPPYDVLGARFAFHLTRIRLKWCDVRVCLTFENLIQQKNSHKESSQKKKKTEQIKREMTAITRHTAEVNHARVKRSLPQQKQQQQQLSRKESDTRRRRIGGGDRFHPRQYEGVVHGWNKKLFLREKIHGVHFGGVPPRRAVNRGNHWIEQYKAQDDEKLILEEQCATTNKSKKTLLFSVAHDDIDNGDFELLSGTFVSRVYETTSHKRFDCMDDFRDWANRKHGMDRNAQTFLWYPPKGTETTRHVVVFGRLPSLP